MDGLYCMTAIGWINLHVNKICKLIHREIQVQEVQVYSL